MRNTSPLPKRGRPYKVPPSEHPAIVARVSDCVDTLDAIAADYGASNALIRKIAKDAGVQRRPETERVGEYWHGTTNGYANIKCRCQPCRDAWNATMKAYMDSHPEQREKKRLRTAAWRREKATGVR